MGGYQFYKSLFRKHLCITHSANLTTPLGPPLPSSSTGGDPARYSRVPHDSPR